MPLAESDRVTVARTLATCLPMWADREAVASRAGMGDVQLAGDAIPAWKLLVDEADERERLLVLVRAAARYEPGDARLIRLVKGVEQGRIAPPRDRVLLLFGVAVAFGLLIGLGWVLFTGGSDPSVVQASAEAMTTQAVPAAPASAAAEGADAQGREPAAAEPIADNEPEDPADDRATERAAGEAEAATTEPETVAAEPAAVEPTTAAEPAVQQAPPSEADPAPDAAFGSSSICRGVEGFAYMGETHDVGGGGVWTTGAAVNVRADYPRRENQWNARTTVRCVLPLGARVQVPEGPIAVDGGAYWARVRGERVAPPVR